MHIRWRSHECQMAVACPSGGGHMPVRWRSHARQLEGIAISTDEREMEPPPWLGLVAHVVYPRHLSPSY